MGDRKLGVGEGGEGGGGRVNNANLYADSEGQNVNQACDSTGCNGPWHGPTSNSISRLGFFDEVRHRVIPHQRPASCS